MKKGGSKQKGSQFEREICKQLGLWWTQDLDEPRDDIFWLCSQSGGRATTRAKQNIDTAYSQGDVTFIDPVGAPFISQVLLELKRGYTKDISILDFIDKKKGDPLLVKWWKKAKDEQELAGRKYTIILFRRDRHISCILLSLQMARDIEDWFGHTPNESIQIKSTDFNFVVIKLDAFLNWCHPNFFEKEQNE